jgi:hypothetical protein
MFVFLRAAALFLALIQLSTATEHSNLRTSSLDNENRRELRPQRKDCTVMVTADASLFHAETHVELEDFLCEIDPADNDGRAKHTLPIKASEAQMKKLKKLLADGDLVRSYRERPFVSLWLYKSILTFPTYQRSLVSLPSIFLTLSFQRERVSSFRLDKKSSSELQLVAPAASWRL